MFYFNPSYTHVCNDSMTDPTELSNITAETAKNEENKPMWSFRICEEITFVRLDGPLFYCTEPQCTVPMLHIIS